MPMTLGNTDAKIRLRKFRQEEMREKMQGIEYIRQLEEISEELKGMGTGKADREVEKHRLEVLKTRIDLNLKRLRKVLPDEQYIEVDANITGELGVRQVVVEGIKTQDA